MHIVTYMRISVTDRCNERCAYCMPHDVAIEWLPRGQILTYEEILRVRPGITDLASLKYRDESPLLAVADPEQEYIRCVLPDKIALAKEYVHQSSFFFDLSLIVRTVARVLLG